MAVVSLLLSRHGQRPRNVTRVAAFVVVSSLLALYVAALVISGGIHPDERLVAPFRWFGGESNTA